MPLTASQLVERLLAPGCPPFALLHRAAPGRPEGVVEVLVGPVEHVDRLADIPLPPGATGAPVTDALALVPYRQIRERGFDVRDDGTPLAVLLPRESHELPLGAVLAALPRTEVRVEGGAFDVDDEAYAGIVERVIADEIGRGEGANFVIRRTFRGQVPGYGPAAALALFGRLLRGERGAYWTYVVHTGERTLVGASPEAHVRVSGGTVVMNPISGTYRYPEQGPSAQGLLDFLHDPKEVEELTMVVDEELKMMCRRLRPGGRGGRAAAQGDGAPRAHRVRAARPHGRWTCGRCCARRCSPRPSPARPCRTPAGSSSATRSAVAATTRARWR